MADYQYTNANFNAVIFSQEIETKPYFSSFQSFTAYGSNVTLSFSLGLSQEDKDDLDALMAAHPSSSQFLKISLAEYRWQREVGGFPFGPYNIPSDRETQAKLIAMRIKAIENPSYVVDFKTPDGFVTLDSANIILIADAAHDHVQKCFHCEKVVFDQIEAETVTDQVGMESAFETEYAA